MREEAYVTPDTLDDRTGAWLERIRRDVRPRDHIVPRPGRCALLIMDMLAYFAAPEGRCYLPAAGAIVPRIQRLLERWRAAGWPVVFTLHGHRGEEDLGMLGRFFSDYIRAGEPQARVIPALEPSLGELLLPKTTYDAFHGTPLEQSLRDGGADQVLITGVLTHMCCETTARSAFCRGFEVHLAADAIATTTEERHLQSLLGMAESIAMVWSSDEVLSRCPITMPSS
jgi:bifunctional isochorismate lyase / aryl carrier protein